MEKAFPRGGRKPISKSFKKSAQKSKKKKQKRRKDETVDKSKNQELVKKQTNQHNLDLVNTNILNGSTVKEDMLLLGCVTDIRNMKIMVSLPGGMVGLVNVDEISQQFTNVITSGESEDVDLSNIIQVSNYYTFKVLSLSTTHNNRVCLTLDPGKVNSKLQHDTFIPGFICTGAVQSKEDHGCVIDFGVASLKSFLHKKDGGFDSLPVGSLIKCVVKDVKARTTFQSNIQVSCLPKDFAVNQDLDKLKLDHYLPGMCFNVTVSKVLKSGLKVTYGSNKTGYVHEDYLVSSLQSLKSYEAGSSYEAVVLYIVPTVKIVFFTLRKLVVKNWNFTIGTIVKGKIVNITKRGLTFNIGGKKDPVKCFVPESRLPKTVTDSEDDLTRVYQLGATRKLRLMYLDYIAETYGASMDKSLITTTHYRIADFNCGEVFKDCIVQEIKPEGVILQINKIRTGFVPKLHLKNKPIQNPFVNLKVGQKVTAAVLEADETKQRIIMTMKSKLLSVKKEDVLSDYNENRLRKGYTGVVLTCTSMYLVVGFFNGVRGKVDKTNTPFQHTASLVGSYNIGQVVKCRVDLVNPEEERMKLTITDESDVNNDVQQLVRVGEQHKVTVIDVSLLHLTVTTQTNVKGKVLPHHISQHVQLADCLLSTYQPGDVLVSWCCSTTPILFTLHPAIVNFYKTFNNSLEDVIRANVLIPFTIKNINTTTKKIYLSSVTGQHYNMNFVSSGKLITGQELQDVTNLSLETNQVVLGRIVKIINENNAIVSISTSDCWDHEYQSSLELLDDYLKKIKKIRIYNRNNGTQLKQFKIGKKFQVKVKNIDVKNVELEVEGVDEDVTLLVNIVNCEQDVCIGAELDGVVVWIDYVDTIVYFSLKKSHVDVIKSKSTWSGDDNEYHNCRILVTTKDVVVGVLKGDCCGTLVHIPTRRCINDVDNTQELYQVGQNTRLHLQQSESKNLLGVESNVYKMHQGRVKKRQFQENNTDRPFKRQKTDEETEDVKPELEDIVEVADVSFVNDVDNSVVEIKEEVASDDGSDVEIQDVSNTEKIIFSSSSDSEGEEELPTKQGLEAEFNWDVLANKQLLSNAVNREDSASSSSEEDERDDKDKKAKKLTRKEKLELAKLEEEKIRNVEETLMNSDREPQTVDDYDRLLMSNPDCSQLWLKYMTFHLQGTEIEKARTVGRRAIKTINFREEQEKLNVWLALLNLENLYGNEESLNQTLEEALQFNDPYKVHVQMLNLYVDGNKFKELEELGRVMLKKYKDVTDVWYDVAHYYMKAGRVELARNVLQKALTVLNKNEHVNLICKFAQLENKLGNQDRSQTLYEQVLSTFPKRVDIWCCYVDMLVKSNKIELARQILDRATSQTLPARKMKTLFKKFLKFEEEYGTSEDVERVKNTAVNFINDLVDDD